MHVSYDDILDRIRKPPIWWSNGVPRYEPFRPSMTSVYAQEAVLVEADCQHCGRTFIVALHSHRPECRVDLEQTNDISLGDPPSHKCDGPGNSMSALPIRILEFWEKVDVTTNPRRAEREWQRVPSFEIEFPNDRAERRANKHMPSFGSRPTSFRSKACVEVERETRAPGIFRRIAETARYRRILHGAGAKYVEGRNYDDLTPTAAAKVRTVERYAVMLALQAFAYDVHCTAATIIHLSREGAAREARDEKAALTGRVLDKWLFKELHLPHPHPSFFELAAPLGLGLGAELENWLLASEPPISEIIAWFEEHGPKIERFNRYFGSR